MDSKLKQPTPEDAEESLSNIKEMPQPDVSQLLDVIAKMTEFEEVAKMYGSYVPLQTNDAFTNALVQQGAIVLKKEITSQEELDSLEKAYPELKDIGWFQYLMKSHKEHLVYKGLENIVKGMLDNIKPETVYTHKKEGYMQLIDTDRKQLVFGYGKIEQAANIQILVIYGNNFITPGQHYNLPLNRWEVTFAKNREQFITWLTDNDYQNLKNAEERKQQHQALIAKQDKEKELERDNNLANRQIALLKERNKELEEQLHFHKTKPVKALVKNILKKQPKLDESMH